MEQSQSFNQANQVISGDSRILSGNNLSCQDQENSNGILEQICDSGVNNSNNDELTMMITTNVRCPHYRIVTETFAPDGRLLDEIQTEIRGEVDSYQVPLNKQTSTMKTTILDIGSPSYVYDFLNVFVTDSQLDNKRMNYSVSKDDHFGQCEVDGLLNTKSILGTSYI